MAGLLELAEKALNIVLFIGPTRRALAPPNAFMMVVKVDVQRVKVEHASGTAME